MTADFRQGLLEVARAAEAAGEYVVAIKSLTAVLESSPLPDIRVIASLNLSRLYIHHTHNYKEAKDILHRLLLFLRDDSVRLNVRCQCWLMLSDAEIAADNAEAALSTCENGMSKFLRIQQGELAQRCWVQFGCKVAQAGMLGAPAWQAVMQFAQKQVETASPEFSIQLKLAKMQAQLVLNQRAKAAETREELQHLFSQLSTTERAQVMFVQLETQYLLLKGLLLIVSGSSQAGASDPSDEMETLFRRAQELVRALEGQNVSDAWLDLGTQAALLALLYGMHLLAHKGGGVDHAGNSVMTYVETGLELLQHQRGVETAHDREDASTALASDLHDRTSSAVLTMLLVLSLMVSLTCTDPKMHSLKRSQEQLRKLQDAVLRRHDIAQHFVPLVHYVTGIYAQMARDMGAAVKHLEAATPSCQDPATDSAPCSLQLLQLVCTVNRILIMADEGADGAVLECARLGKMLPDLSHSRSIMDMSAQEEVLAMLGGAVARAAESDVEAAKALAVRAMKLAHDTKPTSHQLMVLVLATLAPLMLALGDRSGAVDMFKSALSFVKQSADWTLRAAVMRDYITRVDIEDNKTLNYATKKVAAHSSHVKEMRDSQLHRDVVAWNMA